ncbi:MAG: tol-pal system protein YbgF [Deltaproteobacteria bacterium]|nr:tol-pal system protein YbgF [Deltaproteobacteria bacterium]
MNRYSAICMAMLLVATWGCATQDDLVKTANRLDQRVDQRLNQVDQRLNQVDQRLVQLDQGLDRKTTALKESLTKDLDFQRESQTTEQTTLRKRQADVGADITLIRDDLRSIRGAAEQVDMRVRRLEGDTSVKKEMADIQKGLASLQKELHDLSGRLSYLERSLDIVGEGSASQRASVKSEKPTAPVQEPTEASSPRANKPDKEQAYAEAYESFKEGKYGNARRKFEEFQTNFPENEYSDNAQFWIGECYYFEGQFEKAILEYEKVIKNFPKGNKVPSALLKQALAFKKLDDSDSAKLLLQRIIKEYPGTTSAKLARDRLSDIK